MDTNYDVVIIGAGMAGLVAAKHLEDYNLNVLIIDKSDRAGGRIKTDEHQGFLMDYGFQVLLPSYPQFAKHLEADELDLQDFKAGAICFNRDKTFQVRDGNFLTSLVMAFSPVGTLMDKIRLGNLRAEMKRTDVADLFNKPQIPTYSYLKQKGFSPTIVERFFTPFFGGIFLDEELNTSSRMFEFIFKMMAEGEVSIPKMGMEEIPRQLKNKLQRTEFRFHTEAESISGQTIYLKGGETLSCPKIIVATNPDPLIPQLETQVKWQETATYYFAAERSVLNDNIIALNYGESRLVNHFSVISDVSSAYAPKKKHLVAVSLTHIPEKSVEDIVHDIKNELSHAFGKGVDGWKFLRNYHIPKALPMPADSQYEIPFTETRLREGLYLAGDHLLNGSLNAAMKSGELAAKAVVLDF